MSISVVIPVYNSSQMLPELVSRLKKVLETFEVDYELILVNDGSIDHSWKVIIQLLADYPWLKGINLMRNFGTT